MPPAQPKPHQAASKLARHASTQPATTPTRHQIPAPQSSRQAGNPSAKQTRRKNQIAQQAEAWSQLVDVEALADRLVDQSSDREAAALLRPLMPNMIIAMVQGATTPGPSGAADRAALAKLIGAPWASTAADRKGGQSGKTREQGKAVGGRLEAAIARRTRANGAGSDTQDEAGAGEAAPILGF